MTPLTTAPPKALFWKYGNEIDHTEDTEDTEDAEDTQACYPAQRHRRSGE